MKRGSTYLLIFLLLIVSTVAQPFVQESRGLEGIEIIYPKLDSVRLNHHFDLHIQVFNVSNGIPLGVQPSCYVRLFNASGHSLVNTVMFKNTTHEDYDLEFGPGNFSHKGIYDLRIWCNMTAQNIGGFTDEVFEATITGNILSDAEARIYPILFFGVFLLFALSFYFMLTTPYKNRSDEQGAIVKVTRSKYVKLGFILLSWVLLTWLLNLLIGLSLNFIHLPMYLGFFGFIFQVMNDLAFPLGVVILVISGYEIIRDANIQKEIAKFGSAKR